ncbi:MAG TPA: M56 family metallopeptidase [Candidatus Acidoferrales bacterium]|jgi:hypothetical protein|nr:M56 family metallopeptidase [Candidatus Acidoferrales bacterium]
MTIPYLLRLLCLCAATFFLVHSALGLALRLASSSIVRFAHHMRPREATRFLLLLRFLPLALATFVVLGVCLPSYLWLEPGATSENVGTAFIIAAFCGASILIFSILRAGRAVAAARHFARTSDESRAAAAPELAGVNLPHVVLESEAPVIFMAGVIRPRLVLSNGVMRTLSQQQLESVVRHEAAHRTSRDNLKRLLILLSPEILPFARSFDLMDHAWAQFSEWAADDDATGNDPERSLTLAESLVRVARMGAGPRPLPLFTSFIPPDDDFSARVNRLLHPPSFELKSWSRIRVIFGSAAYSLLLLIAVLLVRPSALLAVHQLLERLIH